MAETSVTTQLRRGVIGPCILALLSERSRYGLELVSELNAAGQLLSSQGTIYPLMNRLSEAGMVTSSWKLSDSERPRRYYEITDLGRGELLEFRAEWAHFSAAVTGILTVDTHSSLTGVGR